MQGPHYFLFCLVHLITALTDEEKKTIVEKHNLYRSGADPTATSMKALRWDPSLEKMAAAYASKCIWEHNEERGFRGENLFIMSGSSLDVALGLDDWYKERDFYNFTANSCQEGQMCGHYTQMVWADTERVGCGEKFCEKLEGFDESNMFLLVCNYEPPGNFRGEKPFIPGEPCSSCPSTYICRDSLCVDTDLKKEETSTGIPGTTELMSWVTTLQLDLEPTQSQLDPEPTQSQLDPEPTQLELDPEPTQSELDPELTQSQLYPEPTQSQLYPEPTQSQLYPEPTQSQLYPEPSPSQLDPKPTQSELESEQTKSQLDQELTQSELDPEPSPSQLDPESTQSEPNRGPNKSELETKPTQPQPDRETTQSKQDQELTLSELDQKGTQSQLDSKPTHSPLDREPTQAELDSETIQSELESKPPQSEPNPEPTQPLLVQETTQSEPFLEPTKSELDSEPTQSEMDIDTTRSEMDLEKTRSEVVPKPTQLELKLEPTRPEVVPTSTPSQLLPDSISTRTETIAPQTSTPPSAPVTTLSSQGYLSTRPSIPLDASLYVDRTGIDKAFSNDEPEMPTDKEAVIPVTVSATPTKPARAQDILVDKATKPRDQAISQDQARRKDSVQQPKEKKEKQHVNLTSFKWKNKMSSPMRWGHKAGGSEWTSWGRPVWGPHFGRVPKPCPYPCHSLQSKSPLVFPLYRTNHVSSFGGYDKQSHKVEPSFKQLCKLLGYKKGVYSLYLPKAQQH